MLRLAAIVFIILAPVLAVTAWVAVLSMSVTMASGSAMIYAFAGGVALAVPGSWVIAKMIAAQTRKPI